MVAGCVYQLWTRHLFLPAVHGQRRSCSAADYSTAAGAVIYAVERQAVRGTDAIRPVTVLLLI